MDIWSIGALLYKVIVGVCGFYAVSVHLLVVDIVALDVSLLMMAMCTLSLQQLQDIPRILKHKGDAIAFERVLHSRKINYVMELPSEVNSRLSE